MVSLLIKAAPAVAEGIYTTWTIQGIYDTNIPYQFGTRDFLMVRNDGNVVFNPRGESFPYIYITYIISPDGVLWATLPDNCYLKNSGDNEARCHYVRSLTGRYQLFTSGDDKELIIQEGTVERWRRDVRLDQDPYSIDGQPLYGPTLVAISPSGEWIAAVIYEGTNGLIFIYKGS